MTKRGYIRLFSFITAAFICLAAYGMISANTSAVYKGRLETNYQQSLNELSECLDSIETNLTKSVYANSEVTLYEISTDLFSETNEAKNTLSRLPVNQMNLSGTYKFLSQASDYSSYLSSKIKSGKGISEEEHKNLTKLLEYANKYESAVSDMVEVCNAGGTIIDRNVKNNAGNDVAAISNDFTAAEDAFKNYPTLLYDGPFADAVLNRDAQMLKSANKVSENDARRLAADAIGCNVRELNQQSDDDGIIKCFVYNYNRYSIGITKQGGYVAYMMYGGQIPASSISKENARNIASDYLKKLGYTNMAENYYSVTNNVMTVNYAYKKDDVTYYSDLVKVGVSMNDGKVISIEAKGYLTNHIERNSWKSKVSQKKAQSKISNFVTVKNCKKCVIPKDNGTEKACWEFNVESKETGEEALIYINSETGNEEDIMLLLYTDGGTLTK